MSIDVWVPGGDAGQPGFKAQNHGGAITVGVGTIGQDTSLFGVTSDQNGLMANVFPVKIPTIKVLSSVETPFPNVNYTLRADLTLEETDTLGGSVINTVCTMLPFRIVFSYTTLHPGLWPNYLYDESPLGPGFGLIAPGFYRLTYHWYDYTGAGDNWSFKALDVKEFEAVDANAYHTFTIPIFLRTIDQTPPGSW